MHKILVVDDEPSIRESFSLILEDKYKVLQAASGEAALKSAADQKIDLVYLDIRMPGLDGLETLKMLKNIDPDLEIIMVTAVNDVQKAGQAVKLGAREYIVKPFDVHNVLKLTEQILRRKSILGEGSQVQKKTGKSASKLIGQDEKIIKILKAIQKISAKGGSAYGRKKVKGERVLISGETGTEKELIARIIHEKSGRADLPFRSIHLSCEMSPLEIKNLLFGREKGGGTVFINNLESLPEEIFKTIPIEARLIGGANSDPGVKNKGFFKFFSAALIEIPPLRERSSDIPLLVNHFLEKLNAQYGIEVKISIPALEALAAYSWPGNTQELESLMERLVLSCANNQISLENLPIDILLETTEGSGSGFISTFEREYIRLGTKL